MSDIRVNSIEPIDFSTIRKVMKSREISDSQKVEFFKKNRAQISQVMKTQISSEEYAKLMENRPLIKYRPLKNSCTKLGDKILLANALNIEPIEVPNYIQLTMAQLQDPDGVTSVSGDNFKTLRQYVYRHGTKDEVLAFLDNELDNATDKLKVLYRTLEYNTGGVADYFVRPIHRLDNQTLVKLYNIVDHQLDAAHKQGLISETSSQQTAEWALIRIYQIQNNQKLIKALNIRNKLK